MATALDRKQPLSFNLGFLGFHLIGRFAPSPHLFLRLIMSDEVSSRFVAALAICGNGRVSWSGWSCGGLAASLYGWTAFLAKRPKPEPRGCHWNPNLHLGSPKSPLNACARRLFCSSIHQRKGAAQHPQQRSLVL